jgi:hypothetical protein
MINDKIKQVDKMRNEAVIIHFKIKPQHSPEGDQKYYVPQLTNQNYIHEEIKSRLSLGD